MDFERVERGSKKISWIRRIIFYWHLFARGEKRKERSCVTLVLTFGGHVRAADNA